MAGTEKVERTEFVFPDEQEVDLASGTNKEDREDKPKVETTEVDEIEIVDDTPEADRNRKPLEKEVTEVTDEELQGYSDKVKARIKELTHARHDERRRKEALEREKEEAFRLAQAAMEENRKLKERLSHGESTYVTQAQKLAEVEVEKAKAALKVAHENGDTEAFVEAQTALNRAQILAERVKNFKPAPLPKENEDGKVASQRTQQPPVPQVDARASEWQNRNSWFGKDEEMTSFALGVHQKLVKAGYDTSSSEYYDAIDRRMRQVFTDKFEAPKEEAPEPTKKPATVVAPTQRATSAKKIRLTQTQVALAKRLGVPLEVYARKVAELEKSNG